MSQPSLFTANYIDINALNNAEFKVQKKYLDILEREVYLINPDREKHKWADNELMFRSLMVDLSGEIIDSGFPKARNYMEDPESDLVLKKIIAKQKVFFTEKMDGSLIIRTIINGKVHWRTRGAIGLGEGFEEPIKKLIEEKYPKAKDTSLYNKVSLLFEYTSPENKIIINYNDAQLTSLGYMDYSGTFPIFKGNPEIISKISEDLGVTPVKFHSLPYNLEQAAQLISKWSGQEGIVVWGTLDNGTTMLTKIKSEEYIRLHALRYQMSGEKLRKFCWVKRIETEEQLKNEIYKLGADWEFAQHFIPDFISYIERINYAKCRVAEIKSEIDKRELLTLGSIREMAIALKNIYPEPFDFNIGIQYCRGNIEYLSKIVGAYALELSIASLDKLSLDVDNIDNHISDLD